jgi:hypothetical protein
MPRCSSAAWYNALYVCLIGGPHIKNAPVWQKALDRSPPLSPALPYKGESEGKKAP